MRLAGHPVSVTAIHSRMSGGPPRLRPDSSLHSWRLATSTQPGGAHLPPPVWPPSAVTSAVQFSNGPSCLLSSCSCRPGLHRLRHEQPDWHHSSLHMPVSGHHYRRPARWPTVTTQRQVWVPPTPSACDSSTAALPSPVALRRPALPSAARRQVSHGFLCCPATEGRAPSPSTAVMRRTRTSAASAKHGWRQHHHGGDRVRWSVKRRHTN